jgi:cytochrome c-type biogenesis protein
MKDANFYLSFVAGVLSFLSPCVLPLVPSYISFITGMSFEALTSKEDRKRIRFLTITNSAVFILGFSAVFISLGAASSAAGRVLFQYREWIRIGGGVLIIIFGLFISGIIKLDFLMKERKLHLSGKPSGYIGTFLIGMTFAAGWTPCIGPILGSILIKAGEQGSVGYGLKLLSVYSLGLAIPFFISAYAINGFLSYTKVVYKYMKVVLFMSGLLLIVFGIMLLTNKLRELTSFLPDIGISF